MNLHAIAGPVIGAINPSVPAVLLRSTGYVINPDKSRSPTYRQCDVLAQVQAMTGGDLRQVEGLNLNGTRRSIYLYGASNGAERVSAKGGDLVVLLRGAVARAWLVNLVLEQWPNWCKVAVTEQTDTMNSAFQAFGENMDTTALITLASQGAGIVTSADQTNQNYRGMILGISLTTMTGATVVVAIRGKDAASGDYYTLMQSQPLTAIGFTPLTMYPGVLSTGGSYPQPLPATWDLQVTVTGSVAIVSGTIAASLLQ